MDEFNKVIKRPPMIPNLIIGNSNDSNNNPLISNLQKNNVILNASRRCSTGLLFEPADPTKYNQIKLSNRQISSFRQLKKLNRLQNLHYESYGVGLNGLNNQNQNIYNQNLKLGLLLRSSLPCSTVSTPIHGEWSFSKESEQLLLNKLGVLTPPVQRKQWNNSVKVYDSCLKRNSSESNTSLNRHLDKHLLPTNKQLKNDFNLDNLDENDINVGSLNSKDIFRNFNSNKKDLNNNKRF